MEDGVVYKGFSLGEKLSAKRTDEGQPCRCSPFVGRGDKRASHPALRGHLPPRGKAWNQSFGRRCAFSSAGRRAMYRMTAQTVESSELTSVTPLVILVTTETNSAGWPKMYRLRK